MKTISSQEYYGEVALVRKQVRRIKAMFYALLALAPFVPVLTPMFFLELITDQSVAPEIALYGLFLLNVTVFTVITVTAIGQMTSFRRALRNGLYRRLTDDDIPLLHTLCRDLAEGMGIDFRRVTLWLDRSVDSHGRSALAPGLEQDHAGYHLIIPMGLVCRGYQCSDDFSSMIAHEYAHILHGDVKLWRIAQSLVTSVRRFVPGIVIATVAYVMLESFRGNLQLSPGPIMLLICLAPAFLFLGLSGKVMVLRRRSELLADYVACFFTGTESLQKCLTECTAGAIESDETEDYSYFHFRRGLHPSKYARLHSIASFPDLPPAETMPSLAIPFFSLALGGLILLFVRVADVKYRLLPTSAYKQGINDGAQLAYRESLVRFWIDRGRSTYSPWDVSEAAKDLVDRKWKELPERSARDYDRGFRRGWRLGVEKAFTDRMKQTLPRF